MEDIFKKGIQRTYARGEALKLENDEVSYIVSGIVSLSSVDSKGKRNFLTAYRSGDIFPVAPLKSKLLSGRAIEYRSLSATIIVSVKRAYFEQEALKPRYAQKFLENIYQTVNFKMDRIDNLGQGRIDRRLLERLNFIAHRIGVKHGDSVVVEIQLSNTDIASSIGTTRETVNRLIKRLERSGLITVKNQTIIINSVSELQKMISNTS